jgi:hypothetical protein
MKKKKKRTHMSEEKDKEILEIVRYELYYLLDYMHDHYCNVLSDYKEGKNYVDGYEDARVFLEKYADKLDLEDIEDTKHDMKIDQERRKNNNEPKRTEKDQR